MRIKLENVYAWHKHFVIFPRKIDGHMVFLEMVERRVARDYSGCGSAFDKDIFGRVTYEYRLINKEQK